MGAAVQQRVEGARIGTLAGRDTPLIRNCWYAVGWSWDIAHRLTRRRILDEDILFFRTESGAAVALQNRCPHRSFPLHRGSLDGDNVRCGYHGITFGPDGNCVKIPADDRAAARRAICLKTYPVVEKEPWVWIWPGDPALADPADVPDYPWLTDRSWTYGKGYTPVSGNYLGLHENLLDTTHFTYLHAGNVGTPEYATAPYEIDSSDGRVRITRVLADGVLPKLYDEPMGLVGVPVDRHSDSNFVSPGWHIAHAKVVDKRDGREYRTEVIHAITPETQTTTHYWWAIARDYNVEDVGATVYMERAIIEAFDEDKYALQWIEEQVSTDLNTDFQERSILADRAGLDMRRAIAKMAKAEQKTTG